jgi:ATP-binding cassette subfamily B protein
MTPPPSPTTPKFRPAEFLKVFSYSRTALRLTWQTSPRLALAFITLTLGAGALPGAIAYVSKLLVDAVVQAAQSGTIADQHYALKIVALEAVLVAVMASMQKGLAACESLLRALLSQRVNQIILEKALQLSLRHFEDSKTYDQLTQARQRASTRPLSLVQRTFGLVQNAISLVTYAALLSGFSPWAVLLLVVAGLPLFAVEAAFSGEAFRLFKWQSEETRQRAYLEYVLSNDSTVKEVKIFSLGPLLLERFNAIFHKLYREDRELTLRRAFWSFLLGLVSIAALYGAYAWVVAAAVTKAITLGDMTMYLLVFKQGQAAVSASLSSVGSMYEDNLYLSNLYEFLAEPVDEETGTVTEGAIPGDGVRFEKVSFRYEGSDNYALQGIDLHLKPGEKLALVGENGSGKTTLIKLLTRLYLPTEGRILLDGTPLQDWDPATLRGRIGVIFQDFNRYALKLGENIGAGDVEQFSNEDRWEEAARKGLADEFIQQLPNRYETQLSRWFKGGRELSGGQWQKVALARAFMRAKSDIVVLDEPTSAIDAEAEMRIFEHFREATENQMAILISHRFSTVRMADEIAVMENGRITEMGTHDELVARGGRYARLFELQAAGYR